MSTGGLRNATASAPTRGSRDESDDHPKGKGGRWWPRLRLALTLLFFAAIALLLLRSAREIQWHEVVGVIRGYAATTLLLAGLLAIAGHVVYTTYDMLARRYAGHDLPLPKVAGIAFVSYAFNLNMGPLIGAMGSRYRLYSGAGLSKGTITRVLAFSVGSNWLGYALLAGMLFAARAVELPADWAVGTAALQVLGAVLVALVAAYVWWCRRARGRRLSFRGVSAELPSQRMALQQLAASCACWMAMGAILYVLLEQQVGYFTVLGVLLLGAVTAMATHIPAGLGVLEATFVLLLGHLLPKAELLAAVLAYRVLYYLIPLAAALPVFLWLEARSRHGH